MRIVLIAFALNMDSSLNNFFESQNMPQVVVASRITATREIQ